MSKTKVISFRMQTDQAGELEKLAKLLGTSRSEIVKQAVEEFTRRLKRRNEEVLQPPEATPGRSLEGGGR